MRIPVSIPAFLVFIQAVMLCSLTDRGMAQIREPVAAGSYYPSRTEELNAQLNLLFGTVQKEETDKNTAALIVPHAGYVFSGRVAAQAYARLDPEKTFSRIFLIGTSHHKMLNGASIYHQGNYRTPLGMVKVDTALAARLLENHPFFRFDPGAHNREHSLEVQLPFLQYRLNKPFTIVPIIIGTSSAKTCQSIAEALKPFFTPDNLFIISSDFSHYPDYEEAKRTDGITGQAIAENDPEVFLQTLKDQAGKNIAGLVTGCCAWSAVLTLLNMSSGNPDIKVHHVKYMNSGDSPSGDKKKVVGYHSFVFTREQPSPESFCLSEKEKNLLLKMAREAILAGVKTQKVPEHYGEKLPDRIQSHCGVFVTLRKDGKLRGCIGQFTTTSPLHQTVRELAQAAAFYDKRFSPVREAEIPDIEIEISVLSPLKRIHSPDEFIPEKHGIYLSKGNRSGTYLPQVAEETGWSREELLGHCARDKAGIGWDGWKEADLYIYEALVFKEKELLKPDL